LNTNDFDELSAAALRDYIARHHEKDYLLIDVRQPFEYQRGHIPGARFLPLLDLEASLFSLPAERDLIFYCHTGGRSQAAATLAVEAEVTRGRVFNLAGGMRSWDGAEVAGFPRLQVFDKAADLPALLVKAMNLEKGAWRFYSDLKGRFSGAPLAEVFGRLADTEVLHARLIYPHWSGSQEKALSFDSLFDRLTGDVLEGGQELSAALAAVMMETEAPCLRLLELAMAMEVAAFDLYRTMAERGTETARTVFLSLAQAEKAHIRTLIDGLGHCPA